MHPNETLGELLVKVTNELREHFDCVSITCSVYEPDENQTHQYVYHKGHIGGVIGDLQEHLECLRDMNCSGPAPHEPTYSEEEND